MAARLASSTEPESVKEKPAISEPVIAGVNRSGKRQVGQLADFGLVTYWWEQLIR